MSEKKYTVYEGMNKFFSSSRNVRKHIRDGGYNHVLVCDTKTGKWISEGVRYYDGTIVVTSYTK